MTDCFLIAEIGVNHNGDMQLAKKMIDEAKLAGADAVKFQTFVAERLVSNGTPKVKYQESTTDKNESHFDMIKKLELARDDHFLLNEYCRQKDIGFISTPYDVESARFLHEEVGVEIFKTASADIVDLPLHTYLSKTGKQVIISVGMATLGEIEEVLSIYDKAENQAVTLLHCVANYPCDDQSINMKVINTLRSAFSKPIGYSDHSVGSEAAVLSIAFGATIIEKHFTLDKNLPGPDHKASSTPLEFSELSRAVRRAEKMLGSPIKKCQDEERQMSEVSRKSIVAQKNLSTGDVITHGTLTLKRPGTGLHSRQLPDLMGKILLKPIKAGDQIKLGDFK